MLDPGEYAADVALLLAVAAGFAIAALALRARLLPGWTGAPARLVEGVLWVACLVAAGLVLGLAHLLEPVPIVLGAAAAGIAGAVALRREPRRKPDAPPEAAPPPATASPGPRAASLLALLTSAVVGANWAARTSGALDHGMPNVDTLWYHMPVAARFAQDGSFAASAQTQPDPLTAFYPANAELLHAIGIVLTGHDGLSPLMNLGWLALAMLAAWCIGRPYGAAPLTLLAANVALGSFLMSWSQPGDAGNDIAGLALLLAAVAIVVNGTRDARSLGAAAVPLGLAAVPFGLALGMKVSMIAPVAALLLALAVWAGRRALPRLAVWWGVALAVLGGFWYARNAVVAGSPLPAVDAGIGGLRFKTAYADPVLQAPATGFDSTLAHLLGQPGAWDVVEGGLRADLGPAWWAIVAAAAAGLVAAVAGRGGGLLRALGVSGLVVAVAYVFTPQSGTSFAVNVRHLMPALVLGLVLVPLLPALRTPARARAVAVALALLFVTAQLADDVRAPGHGDVWVAAALGLALLAGAAVALARSGRRRPLAAGALAVALAVVAGGFFVERAYLRERYADPALALVTGPEDGRPLAAAHAWARDLRDATIARTGTQLQYPFMGQDLSNRVRYVHDTSAGGRIVRAIRTCEAWRRELVELGADYVVVTPVRFPLDVPAPEPREVAWTRSLEGVEQIASYGGKVFVFRVVRPPARGCA